MTQHKPTRRVYPLSKSKYWEEIGKRWSSEQLDPLWRRHSDKVNGALLHRWLPREPVKTLLKTDLFDEVHGEGLIPLLQPYARHIIGMDIADTAIKRVLLNHLALTTVKADARHLPFDNDAFDVIVSTSTIDHFQTIDEFTTSICEFSRVLKPRGQLLLTIDNLANPIIFTRNRLPFEFLNRLGLVPYYVGATCGPGRLKTLVSREGLTVQEVTAIEHCPRVLAVVLSRIVSRYFGPKTKKIFLSTLMMFEQLNRLPTRFLSGYYVAVRAEKPETGRGI